MLEVFDIVCGVRIVRRWNGTFAVFGLVKKSARRNVRSGKAEAIMHISLLLVWEGGENM